MTTHTDLAAKVRADLHTILGNRPFAVAGLPLMYKLMGADWGAMADTIIHHHAIPLEGGLVVFVAHPHEVSA